MKILKAENVLSKIKLQEDIDYDSHSISIYECPICKNKLAFKISDFKRHALLKKSIFLPEEQNKIATYVKEKNMIESNSFIDFYCPKCKHPTRIYYTSWAGGRYTAGYILNYIVI